MPKTTLTPALETDLLSKVVVIPEAVWEGLPAKIRKAVAEALKSSKAVNGKTQKPKVEKVEKVKAVEEEVLMVNEDEVEYRPRTKEELKRDFLTSYKEAKEAIRTGNPLPTLKEVIEELKAEHAAEKVRG